LELVVSIARHQLIKTVGAPTAAIAPQMQASLVRKAGRLPIRTVTLPAGKTLLVG
jgi:hypothetical protein